VACYDGLPDVPDVRAIIATELSDEQVEGLILDAELMVRTCVASLDEERQCAIIKYVTADLIASAVEGAGAGAVTSSRLGDAADTYAASTEFPGRSSYWDKAVLLDPNGCLRKLGRKSAFFEKV
jgi:hypothetical protein